MSHIFLIAVAEKSQAGENALILASAGIPSHLSLRKENPTSPWVIEVESERLLEAQQLITDEEPPRPSLPPEPQLSKQNSPAWIAALIILNMVVWWRLEQNGGSHDSTTLLSFGAFRTLLLADGEWWRMVTAMFLHIDLKHLAGNMASLGVAGILSLRTIGLGRVLFIYVMSRVIGNYVSYLWNSSFTVKAGASGAILGLLGALSAVRPRQVVLFPDSSRYKFWHVPAMLIAFYGFVIGIGPSIDHAAHIGGLMTGSVFGALIPLFPEPHGDSLQWLAGGFAVLLCLISWFHVR